VDSGAVNPDRWRSFATHHDGEDEPARPSGDGQGGGWHHVQTFRSVWQSAKVAESVEGGEWGLPVRIRAERGTDDVTPVWLSLMPQNITLETDGDGNLLAGLLPLTVQARLFKWNSLLTDVAFSLVAAPAGISISSNGVITVAANAALGEANRITVRASYQGAEYSAALSIDKNINNSAPRYLGAVEALSAASPTVVIVKGPATGIAQARQGDYVLAVAPAGGRLAGSVFQWGGIAWEYRAPQNHANLYISCFKDGLEVPALSQDIGWFGGVLAELIVAQKGFIEELQSQVIKLNAGGAVYGGGKFLANGNANPQAPAGAKGFWLGANGEAKLEEATVSGAINAKSGKFHGDIEAVGGTLDNVTINQNCTVKGELSANHISVAGSHQAGDAPTIASNPYVVAFDNREIDNADFVSIGAYGYYTKRIKIVGRGSVRFRVNFRGKCTLYDEKLGGSPGQAIRIVSFTEKQTQGEAWSGIINLNEDVTFVQLYGADRNWGGGSVDNFVNTIFECRTASNPGLFKFMSAPF